MQGYHYIAVICQYCKSEFYDFNLYDEHMLTHEMDQAAEDRLDDALGRPLLYVAGPMMSHGNPLLNVRQGCFAASQAFKAGWTPIVPHIDILYQLITGEDVVEDYLVRDYAYIKACKAVWFLPGWEHSHGAKEEMKLVKAHNILHFFGETAVTPAQLYSGITLSTKKKPGGTRPTGPGDTGSDLL